MGGAEQGGESCPFTVNYVRTTDTAPPGITSTNLPSNKAEKQTLQYTSTPMAYFPALLGCKEKTWVKACFVRVLPLLIKISASYPKELVFLTVVLQISLAPSVSICPSLTDPCQHCTESFWWHQAFWSNTEALFLIYQSVSNPGPAIFIQSGFLHSLNKYIMWHSIKYLAKGRTVWNNFWLNWHRRQLTNQISYCSPSWL